VTCFVLNVLYGNRIDVMH